MRNIIVIDNMIINKTPSAYWSLAKPFNTSNGGQNDQLHASIRPNRPLNFASFPFSNISYGGEAAMVRARRETRVKAATAVKAATGFDGSVSATAVITVKPSVVEFFTDIGFDRLLDEMTDLCGRTLLLELVSAEVDPKSGKEKETIKAYAKLVKNEIEKDSYEAHFKIPKEFGEVGAVVVENQHHKELYLANIVLDGLPFGPLRFPCYSWVHSKFDSSQKRIFFIDKSYLPSQTPSGLKEWRDSELEKLRGNGQGERKVYERIYDYDTYNDIGNPDSDLSLLRPVLGGQIFPYPRRCRTGRPPSQKDPESESRSSSVYVPRDEQFSEIKEGLFLAKSVYSILHGVVPGIEFLNNPELNFPFFTDIDTLYYEGISLPGVNSQNIFAQLLKRIVKGLDKLEAILRFEPPELLQRDRFAWFRDEEFSRQTLAGLNPSSIKLVTEWPLMSKLDPKIYGPPTSAITKELIEIAIGGLMTLEEAIEQKKLFMLDYHDAFLPYVHKVRELKGTTLYGSRTLFFLSPDGTLKPLAIELTRPQIDEKPQWKQVFTPSSEATSFWLWRLAKAHVLAHDSAYHQLISHWLRTHCCTEPYIIAANRQLSAMHPIYRLLHPHFRYTMAINARARSSLINASGTIENSFSPGKYSMEISSFIYGLEWRFDHQSLPADLINRGMAIEDPSLPHGLKLTIEDYPYANDGLILWDSIKLWVTDYVNYYYPESTLIESDHELQAWWTEIRTIGHGDKKHEPWWPNLKTNQDLIEIITTIIWVSSAHHAAVNFGQYAYAGYFPNRPTIARTKIPTEDSNEDEMKHLLENPEQVLLHCFPSQKQAITVMAVLDVLSNHSTDEQYIGGILEPSWEAEPAIKSAFEIFQGRIKELEGIIDKRNLDSNLKNRNGAGIVPYELLKPFSDRGVTNMGVPNSISI